MKVEFVIIRAGVYNICIFAPQRDEAAKTENEGNRRELYERKKEGE
jgi:hypothetical protein